MAVRGGWRPLSGLICVNSLVREILHLSGKSQGKVGEFQTPMAVATITSEGPKGICLYRLHCNVKAE